jgi:hypothetical protein
MAEPTESGSGKQLEAMFSLLADEQHKLADFQAKVNEARTVAESPDKMLTATFDGRGELVKLTVNNGKYRRMAPAELGVLIMETINRGRAEAFGKLDDFAGADVLPGVRFGELAAGNVDLNEVVGALMTSAVDLPGIADAARKAGRTHGR